MSLMFDSVNPDAFPASGFDATAGYVDGLYNNTAAIRARFPNLPHVTIAVFARDDAMCLDVENGDATPTEAVAWLDRQYTHGVPKPILYCNTSTIDAVRAAVGSRPFWWWAADYTGTPHLPAGADACQFTDHGPNGENVDQTLMSDAFYAAITPHDTPIAFQEAEMMLLVNQTNGATVLLFSTGVVKPVLNATDLAQFQKVLKTVAVSDAQYKALAG